MIALAAPPPRGMELRCAAVGCRSFARIGDVTLAELAVLGHAGVLRDWHVAPGRAWCPACVGVDYTAILAGAGT